MENVKNFNTSTAELDELNSTIIFWDADNIERLKMEQRPINPAGEIVALIRNGNNDFIPKVVTENNQPKFTDEEYSEFIRRASCACIWG